MSGDTPPPLPPHAEGQALGSNGVGKEGDKGRSRSLSKEHRRRDRDSDRDRRKRSRSRSRDRRRRSRSRSRSRRRGGDERRREAPPPRSRRERTPPEVRREKMALMEREREQRKLDRDTRTVFAYNLPLRAEEKELFGFFSRAGAIVDIKMIRDRNSGRSKGFAYIEFERKEDIIAALSLTGQPLLGQAVMVKMSEAEKNMAWEAAEQQKAQQKALEVQLGQAGMSLPGTVPGMLAGGYPGMGMGVGMAPAAPTIPCRLAASNLHPSIAENDLRSIFNPFASNGGSLDYVQITRDPMGISTGNAIIQFSSLADGTNAQQSLDGMDIAGSRIRVAVVPLDAPPPQAPMQMAGMMAGMVMPGQQAMAPVAGMENALLAAAAAGATLTLNEKIDNDANDGGGMKLTAQSRAALMTRLAANAGMDVPAAVMELGAGANMMPMGMHSAPAAPSVPSALAMEQGVLGPASPIPTQCLLLKNMFDPAEETESDWDAEIASDVREECEKYGPVEHIHIDKDSKGFVYLRFGNVAAASSAQRALHGRWFAARQICADFQFTTIYNSHFRA